MANNQEILDALIKQAQGLANTSVLPNSSDEIANVETLSDGGAGQQQETPFTLEGLLGSIGQVAGGAFQSARSNEKEHFNILKNLIQQSTEGADKRRQAFTGGFQEGAGTQQPASQPGQANSESPEDARIAALDPIDSARFGAVLARARKQVNEAADNNVPLEDMASQILSDKPTDSNATNAPEQGQQGQLQGSLQQMLQSGQIEIRQGGGFDPGGISQENGKLIITQPSKMFQFGISQSGSAAGLKTLGDVQTLLGEKPLQKGEARKLKINAFIENFKQDRKDQREVLKAELKAGGVSNKAATIGAGVSDLIGAWDDIRLKGRAGGVLGTLGGIVGFQRGERDAFTSFATGLAFSFGEHVLGQKGRAFTDNERKEITKNIIGASLNQTEGQFKKKMNSIIKQVNNRIPAGGEKVPGYDAIRRGMKSGSGIQTTQQANQAVKTFKAGSKGKALGINFTVE